MNVLKNINNLYTYFWHHLTFESKVLTTLNNKNKYLKINFQYKKAYKQKKNIQKIHPTL